MIANLADLGPRVEADVEAQSRAEARKREELRRRIEERKRLEEVAGDIEEVETANKGFVALSDIRDKWAEKEMAKQNKKATKPVGNGVVLSAPALYIEPGRPEKLPKISEEGSRIRRPRDGNSQPKSMKQEPPTIGSPEKRASVPQPPAASPTKPPPPPATTSNGSAFPSLPSLIPEIPSAPPPSASTTVSTLELEPVSQPRKKRSLLKRLNSRTSPVKNSPMISAVPMTPAVRSVHRNGSLGSSRSVTSAESLRDSQVIKAYS